MIRIYAIDFLARVLPLVHKFFFGDLLYVTGRFLFNTYGLRNGYVKLVINVGSEIGEDQRVSAVELDAFFRDLQSFVSGSESFRVKLGNGWTSIVSRGGNDYLKFENGIKRYSMRVTRYELSTSIAEYAALVGSVREKM